VVLLELTWALPSKCYCGFSLQSHKYDLKDVAIWECISGTLQEREYEIKVCGKMLGMEKCFWFYCRTCSKIEVLVWGGHLGSVAGAGSFGSA
jgi:hypothetical protein